MLRIPFARGQQYLCALAINNGAHPVWIDEHDSAQDITEQARSVLLAALGRGYSAATTGDME